MGSPPKWFLFMGFMLATVSPWAVAEDSEGYDFPYPMNRLGWADASGKLSIWVNGGWKVGLGGGESLPLRFHFSSMQDRVSEGILGVGWWVPLLESTVVKIREDCVRVTTLGGQSVYLYADSEKTGRFVSPDRAWSGELRDSGRFDIQGAGGWRYFYRDGRIESATPPSGSPISWKYVNRETPYAIEGKDGRTLVRVVRDGNEVADKIQVEGVGNQLEFRMAWGDYPVLNRVMGADTLLGVKETISGISVRERNGQTSATYLMPIQMELADAHSENTFYSMSALGPGFQEELKWSPDGLLESDGIGKYNYKTDGAGGFSLFREIDGKITGYGYDRKRGIVERLRDDGQKEAYHLIRSHGRAYGKMRKRERMRENGKREAVDTYHYDLNGEPLRRISHEFGIDLLWDRELHSWIIQKGNAISKISPVTSQEGSGHQLIGADGGVIGYANTVGKLEYLTHKQKIYYFGDGDPSRILHIADIIDWSGAEAFRPEAIFSMMDESGKTE